MPPFLRRSDEAPFGLGEAFYVLCLSKAQGFQPFINIVNRTSNSLAGVIKTYQSEQANKISSRNSKNASVLGDALQLMEGLLPLTYQYWSSLTDDCKEKIAEQVSFGMERIAHEEPPPRLESRNAHGHDLLSREDLDINVRASLRELFLVWDKKDATHEDQGETHKCRFWVAVASPSEEEPSFGLFKVRKSTESAQLLIFHVHCAAASTLRKDNEAIFLVLWQVIQKWCTEKKKQIGPPLKSLRVSWDCWEKIAEYSLDEDLKITSGPTDLGTPAASGNVGDIDKIIEAADAGNQAGNPQRIGPTIEPAKEAETPSASKGEDPNDSSEESQGTSGVVKTGPEAGEQSNLTNSQKLTEPTVTEPTAAKEAADVASGNVGDIDKIIEAADTENQDKNPRGIDYSVEDPNDRLQKSGGTPGVVETGPEAGEQSNLTNSQKLTEPIVIEQPDEATTTKEAAETTRMGDETNGTGTQNSPPRQQKEEGSLSNSTKEDSTPTNAAPLGTIDAEDSSDLTDESIDAMSAGNTVRATRLHYTRSLKQKRSTNKEAARPAGTKGVVRISRKKSLRGGGSIARKAQEGGQAARNTSFPN